MGDGDRLAAFPSIAPNLSSLPYAPRYRSWRFALRLLGYGAGLASVVLSAGMLIRDPGAPYKLVLAAFWLAGGVFCAAQLWRLRNPVAVFHADRVEKPGLLRPSVLHRANVKGVGKVIRSRYGSSFEIVSNTAVEPSIELDGWLRDDPIVAQWLRGATDPTAEAVKADRDRVRADPRYGATADEREGRLNRTKAWVLAFNLACGGLGAWVWFFAKLDSTVLLAAFAPLAVAMAIVTTSDGLVIWFGRGTARPMVVLALAPGLALAARAGFDVHMLEVAPLAWVSAAAAVAAALFIYARPVAAAARVQTAISAGALTGLATYGLGVALNVYLDRSPSQGFAAQVASEHVSQGRHTSYNLYLTPWAERPAASVGVSSELYASSPVGAWVCMARHGGALGLAWFDIALCPRGREVEAFLNGVPATSAGYLSRGSLLLERQEFTSALADFNKAAAIDRRSSMAFADMAVAQAWLGRDAEARSSAARALEIDPRQYIALHALALVDAGQGQTSKAIADLDQALAIRPDDRFALGRRIALYSSIGDTDGMLKDSDALLRVGPDSGWLRELRAEIMLRRGEVPRALAEADAWIGAAPGDPQGHVIRATILDAVGRKPEADAEFVKALHIRPTVEAYTARASYRDPSDLAGRLGDLDAALQLAPRADFVRIGRGSVEARMGRQEAAIADFERVRRTGSRNAAVLNALCYTEATSNLSLQLALQDCDAALALAPRTSAFLDSRGFVLLRLGRYEEAIANLDAALALRPSSAASLFGRGIAKLRANRVKEGKADLEAARAISPEIERTFADYGVRP